MSEKSRIFYVRSLSIVFIIAIMASLVLCVSSKRTSGDFDVYYAASRNYLAHAPMYIPGSGIEEFKYSPLFALAFSPLAMLPKFPALYLWNILNIVLLFAVFFLFYKLELFSLNKPRDFLIILCLFALAGRFVFSHIKIGQANIIIAFLLSLVIYFDIKGRDYLAATALALSLTIKFFPLLFLVYFVFRRRFKLVGFTLLMIAAFLLFPALYSGIEQNFKYLKDWWALLRSTPAHLFYSSKNYSLISFFSWLFIVRQAGYFVFDVSYIPRGLSPVVYFSWGLSCFILFIAFFYDVVFDKNRSRDLIYLDYSGLFVCGLLFNPLTNLNALVLLVVPYFFILRSLFYPYFNKKLSFVVALLTAICFITTVGSNRAFFGNIVNFYNILQYKLLMWMVILVYLILFIIKSGIRFKESR